MNSPDSRRGAAIVCSIVIALAWAAAAQAQVVVRFAGQPGEGGPVGGSAREGGVMGAGAWIGQIVARSYTFEGSGTPTGDAASRMGRSSAGHEVRLYRIYDRASPLLAEDVLNARHFAVVEIEEGMGAGAGEARRAVRLEDVVVTGYQLINADAGAAGGGRGDVQEIVTMVFARTQSMAGPNGSTGSQVGRDSWNQR